MTGHRKPTEPPERNETVRRKILALLSGTPLSAKQISARAGISEKEVYTHLPHLGKTVSTLKGRLAVIPAECRRCGFAFRKRERWNRPGRCPVCRGESISEPLFFLK